MRIIVIAVVFLSVIAGCGPGGQDAGGEDLLSLSWDEIEEQARGTEVNLMMWQGDPFINKYMTEFVRPALEQQYGITLNISGGQGTQIVSLLLAEKEAGKKTGAIDLGWINGETFYQLRQIDGLFGPFADKLPNAAYIDWDNPFINTDFQQPVNGMECPWGNVQLAFIYDTLRVPQPPASFDDIPAYVAAHPGVFTIPNEFTGMTILKSWMMALAGDNSLFEGAFSEEVYKRYSTRLWQTINEIKPAFWKEGKTFPETLSALHQMFANGEVNFTFSNNDGEVDNKVNLGFFPATARSYVPYPGTIQNSHYMGITFNAPNKPGAMAVVNFLISANAQLQKFNPDVWGDGTVLDMEKLPEEWREKFKSLPSRRYAPRREAIQDRALMEPAPEYMIRLYEDFRKYVIEAD